MKKNYLRPNLGLVPLISLFHWTSAQNTILASGGTTTISNKEFEWAIGSSIAGSFYNAPNLVVTEGTVQPYTEVLTFIQNEMASPSSQWAAFPNPTNSLLFIQLEEEGLAEVTLTLSNLEGQQLSNWSAPLHSGKLTIDLGHWPDGTYLLGLHPKADPYKLQNQSFLIQKTQK